MKQLRIERYMPPRAAEWDEFVASARNSTFLLYRGFMDYHSDRFEDHSLMVWDKNRLIALLPANMTTEDDGTRILHSHSGLTYGGWIVGERHPEAGEMLEIFRLLREYCRDLNISGLDYKPIPFIYSPMPAQEDLYALFREGAELTQRNISVAINFRDNPGFNSQQKRNLKRAMNVEAIIRPEIKMAADDYSEVDRRNMVAEFHRLLTECLSERHGVRPVHTEEELALLVGRFPEKIKIVMIYSEGRVEAGVCLFDCGNVIHAQYICSTERGRRDGLLTRLFDYLIDPALFPKASYFDFGICNEAGGYVLNEGLYHQKSGLGGSGVAYDRYMLRF